MKLTTVDDVMRAVSKIPELSEQNNLQKILMDIRKNPEWQLDGLESAVLYSVKLGHALPETFLFPRCYAWPWLCRLPVDEQRKHVVEGMPMEVMRGWREQLKFGRRAARAKVVKVKVQDLTPDDCEILFPSKPNHLLSMGKAADGADVIFSFKDGTITEDITIIERDQK